MPGWSAGTVQIYAPRLDEQAAFKVRALWERDKGRDLFDLWAALTQGGGNPETIASLFNENYRKEGFDPAKLVDNLHNRLNTGSFESDLKPFVRTWPPYTYQPAVALDLIRETIISRLE